MAAKDKLTELQLRARQLLDQVEQIQKEQDYQRHREERFRLTSESTNQRVLWWSITQTVIVILTGIWQMRHLRASLRPRSWCILPCNLSLSPQSFDNFPSQPLVHLDFEEEK